MSYVSRRLFMQGAAGLVVAFSLPRAAAASAATVAAESVDAYLAVAPTLSTRRSKAAFCKR